MLLREVIGEVLRRHRLRQHRTLREVSSAAAVSLGYLSEVERGVKEPSSELLASICDGLEVPIAEVLREVSEEFAMVDQLSMLPIGFAGSTTVLAPHPLPAGAASAFAGTMNSDFRVAAA